MKKLFWIIFGLCMVAVALTVYVWSDRAHFAAAFLARQLGVPVHIGTLQVDGHGAHVDGLWIGNPPRSKTFTSFSAESIDVVTTPSKMLGTPLLIEEIEVQGIFVGIEYYDSSKRKSNWGVILDNPPSAAPQASSKDYLIRTLRLRQLEIEVTQANGKVTRYTLPEMEFHDLTSKTGFPVHEIEKAIFNQMMQNLIQQFNLDQLMDLISPVPIPKNGLFPLFP